MQNIVVADPVLWFEGMPLLPQHFQQEFAHYQNLFHAQLQILGGYNYGIIDFEIDTLALIKNIFKINKIFAVMPDGLIVKIENTNYYNLEYVLPNPGEFEKNNLCVYLTLPKLLSDNYLIGKYPRYKKENYSDIVDLHSGQDPVDILKMLPNVHLHSDLDINANYTTIKLANLKIDKNLWSLTEYLPATIKITSSHKIYSVCSEICYSLRRKINHLSELVQSKSTGTEANFISENLFYAQGLGSGLPALEGLLYTNQAHPFQLYLSLCGILGGLGLLTSKFAPPSPNIYQHEELLDTFLKLKNDIDGIINAVIDEKVTQVYFQKEDNIYSVEVLKEYLIDKHFMLGFKKKPSVLESDFLAWVKSSIICDSKQIELTLQNRTLGYQRERLERTEDILPTRGVYLFKINGEAMIEDSEKLSVFNYDDLTNSPEEIFVFVKKSQRK